MRAMSRGRTDSRRPAALLGVLCAAIVLAVLPPTAVLTGSSASASPSSDIPSAGEVAQAKRATKGKAGEVARIEKALNAAQARAEKAEIKLSIATENYDAARVDLDRRTRTAQLAKTAAAKASSAFTDARKTVGQIAAQQYRDGGNLGPAAAVLGSAGPQEVLDRASFYDVVGLDRDRAVRQLASKRGVSEALEAQAGAARADQAAAAARLETARKAAAKQADSARQIVAETQSQQASLIQQLAKLRATSVALEQQRRAGLERQRQERIKLAREKAEREKAARAKAAREKAARDKAARDNAAKPNAGHKATPNKQHRSDGATPGSDGGSSSSSSGSGQGALDWARTQLGKPYEWGAAGPDSYDCSGLTMRAWEHAGVGLAHSSRYQYDQVAKVSYNNLRPGDLIFWAYDTSDSGTIHHVALYAGGGMILEAPYTGANVRIAPMRWGGAMPYAGRP
jgi:cell wall-associated NlpC family hydrolase